MCVCVCVCVCVSARMYAPVHSEDPNREEDGADADEDPQAVNVADLGHEQRAQEASEPAIDESPFSGGTRRPVGTHAASG